MHSSDMRSKIMERDVFDEDDLGECDGVGRRFVEELLEHKASQIASFGEHSTVLVDSSPCPVVVLGGDCLIMRNTPTWCSWLRTSLSMPILTSFVRRANTSKRCFDQR